MVKKLYLDNTIEFLKGRVYLGAYDYIPTDNDEVTFFTMEEDLYYNSFHLDFGPFNIGHLYRFAVKLHDLLTREENLTKAIVFYSSTSTRQRANFACLLCCYMILIQSWTPHQVLQPISQIDPPFMPFRDAGYSNADFEINIQDICYGCWRAKECGLIDLQKMDLDNYEYYERVENGDMNILTPNFIAFASPRESTTTTAAIPEGGKINKTFKKVINIFKKTNVQLVVRLNSHLYNKTHFENNGINHLDMIFEDGSCPDMSIVTNFIGCVETVINQFDDSVLASSSSSSSTATEAPKIAVHCKAGLGRTGCLIGAYLIYKHGFTANECIGFLRVIRPGMVVGPQQHWLYLNQQTFREWKYTMRMSLEPSDLINGMYPLISIEEYKLQKRKIQQENNRKSSSILQQQHEHELEHGQQQQQQRRNISGVEDLSGIIVPPETASPMHSNLKHGVPLRSPGQPRKGHHGSNTIEDINNGGGKRSIRNSSRNAIQEEDINMLTRKRSVTPIDDNDMKMLYIAKQQQQQPHQQQQQQRRSSGKGSSMSSTGTSIGAFGNTGGVTSSYGINTMGNMQNTRTVSGGSVRKISGSYKKGI